MSDNRAIRTLVAAQRDVKVAAVEAMIANEPGLHMVGLIDNERDWHTRGGYELEALIVVCGRPSTDVLDIIAEEAAARPALPVVVVCGFSPNGFLRDVFDAGADDIVFAPDLTAIGGEVFFSIEKALTRKAMPKAVDTGAGKLICMLGPKGGTGKTLTASNLAVALALEGNRVALIDLDLQFGDLGIVLGLRPERTIFDLATSGGTLDGDKLEAFLAHHESGLRVLLAPTRPDHASTINPEFLRELYAVIRDRFDYVVVDTPPGFTPEVIATVDAAAAVVLIGTLDLPSLKNAKLGAETLALMAYPTERIKVVLNRADSNVGVSQSDAVSVLGWAPDVLVPSSRDVVRSVNAGRPIVLSAPKSDASKAFRGLAKALIAENAPAEADKHTSRGRGRRVRARS